jgi:FkbM family methyltransferase
MLNRLVTAFDKLFFCMRISAGIPTFCKLLYNTKKLKWHKRRGIVSHTGSEAIAYTIILNRQLYTIYLRTLEGDIDIFYEIFWKKIYSPPPGTLTGSNNVFIDLGANVGMAALYFNAFYKPKQIICVEPATGNFNLLVKNTAPLKKITPVQAAIMAQDGWAKITGSFLHYNNKTGMDTAGNGACEALTMQRLYRQYQLSEITLLKIDIEGAEEDIFRNDTGFLGSVQNTVIEIHSAEADNICLQTLSKNGYRLLRGGKQGTAETVFWALKH